MRPLVTIDPSVRLLVDCSLKRRKGLFWSLYVLPVGTALLATFIFPRLWFAYLIGLGMAFAFLLVVVQGFELRVSASNWGRYEERKDPIGFWITQVIWTALWLAVSTFPVLIAIQKASQ